MEKTSADKLAEIKAWKSIYPVYINKVMSRQQGKNKVY